MKIHNYDKSKNKIKKSLLILTLYAILKNFYLIVMISSNLIFVIQHFYSFSIVKYDK